MLLCGQVKFCHLNIFTIITQHYYSTKTYTRVTYPANNTYSDKLHFPTSVLSTIVTIVLVIKGYKYG